MNWIFIELKEKKKSIEIQGFFKANPFLATVCSPSFPFDIRSEVE